MRFQHLRAEFCRGLRQRERLRDDEVAGGQGLQDEKIETRFRLVRSERGAEILGQRSRREWAALCGLKRGLVDLHPGGELLQATLCGLRERAVGQWADVEREGAAVVGVGDERRQQPVEVLPLEIESVIAPRVIHRAGRFPRDFRGVFRVGKLVVAHRNKIRAGGCVRGDAAVDHAKRGALTDELDQLVTARGRDLVFRGLAPRIEPEHVGLVTRDQLRDLRQALLVPVALELRLAGLRARRVVFHRGPRWHGAACVLPVLPVGVVESELHAVLAASGGKFAEQIAPGCAEGRGGQIVG